LPNTAPKQLWADFKSAVSKALDEVEKANLIEAWKTTRRKTEFYEWVLMPAVAKRLSLKLQIERLRCDYTFLDPNGVPLIAVESENAHPTAWQEMESLCSLAAPLKVLVLSCDWQASEKDKYLLEWTDIIRKHHAVVSVDCLYAVVVGEWRGIDSCLIQYSFALIDTNGKVIEESYHPIAATKNMNH
jgi:hypothetical protein